MPTKDERRAEAAKHIALMKGVFGSEIEACAKGAKIYEDGDGRELPIPDARFKATETRVTTDFASQALFSAKGRAAVVDAASFTRPGGNYADGAFGPEQALCADSILYPVLCELKESYYDKNRGWESGMLFTDRALYLEDVTFSRKGNMKKAGVVVIAAPNRTRALENHRSPEGCDQALSFRIEAIMRIAAAGGADSLVVGAFGCGSYGNDPAQVAGLFGAWLDAHPGVFEEVVFAVPRASFEAFNAAFGEPVATQATAAGDSAGGADEADDDEDWRDNLPEGVTLG